MFLMSYFEIFLAVLCFVIFAIVLRMTRVSKRILKTWPVVGMLQEFFCHIRNFHEGSTKLLEVSNCNFMARGLWLSNTAKILFTVDPANICFMMSTDFGNFPRGPEFKRIFDVFRDGIFNADFDAWNAQRRMSERMLLRMNYHKRLVTMTKAKLEDGLAKLFDELFDRGIKFDLQDVFFRLTFVLTCNLVSRFDPKRLSIDIPEATYSKAMCDAEEVILYGHVFPEWSWRLLRLFGIGTEAKLARAREAVDEIIWGCIEAKRKGVYREAADLITSYMLEDTKSNVKYNNKLMRDTVFSFLFAGAKGNGAALTWVFWCLSNNPSAESKLHEEIDSATLENRGDDLEKLIDNMVYLHGVVCEALTLYPPIPFQHKHPIRPAILPSGHRVDPKMEIVIGTYSMGRMKSIWGEDCREFKPERWITEGGKIKHQPSHKLFTCHSGSRACLRKDRAISQLRIVVASISRNYGVRVIEGQKEEFTKSILLMKRDGMKAKIVMKRRS